MDAFSAQIVKFVREMPDDALLELVKQKLGVIGKAVGHADVKRPPSPARAVTAVGQKAKATRPALREKPRVTSRVAVSVDRQGLLDDVERIVKAGSGMSASDVAKAANLPQTRAAAALKELKLAKRIFQGGDRRFARYAGDARTAEQASAFARKTAKGPQVRGSAKGGARSKKRSVAAPPPAAAAA